MKGRAGTRIMLAKYKFQFNFSNKIKKKGNHSINQEKNTPTHGFESGQYDGYRLQCYAIDKIKHTNLVSETLKKSASTKLTRANRILCFFTCKNRSPFCCCWFSCCRRVRRFEQRKSFKVQTHRHTHMRCNQRH